MFTHRNKILIVYVLKFCAAKVQHFFLNYAIERRFLFPNKHSNGSLTVVGLSFFMYSPLHIWKKVCTCKIVLNADDFPAYLVVYRAVHFVGKDKWFISAPSWCKSHDFNGMPPEKPFFRA